MAQTNGKVRLVTDCRRANAWFASSRHVQLATGSSLSQLMLKPGEQFYVADFDIQNAFYSLQLPKVLRPYRCCPEVTAREMVLRRLGGGRRCVLMMC